ncbi:MAG: 16S rRNA (uracil(1498)-N(3))-methyltransferase [Candidatus Omnitrophota bacterium]
MARFYVPKENVKEELIYIDGNEAKHILNVMRLKEADKVVIFDGTGKEYAGFIKDIKQRSLVVEIVSTRVPKADKLPTITLVQAIPKRDRMDQIVEKATELGVSAIIPLISARTITKVRSEKEINKAARWRKIAQAAAKQCGRVGIPEIGRVRNFEEIMGEVRNYDLACMACLADDTIHLKDAISNFKAGKAIFLIGPEGDFTPKEITMANDASCKLITLGSRVLKSDTAGLYILSVLNYEFSK